MRSLSLLGSRRPLRAPYHSNLLSSTRSAPSPSFWASLSDISMWNGIYITYEFTSTLCGSQNKSVWFVFESSMIRCHKSAWVKSAFQAICSPTTVFDIATEYLDTYERKGDNTLGSRWIEIFIFIRHDEYKKTEMHRPRDTISFQRKRLRQNWFLIWWKKCIY